MAVGRVGQRGALVIPACFLVLLAACAPHPRNPPPPRAAAPSALPPPVPVIVEGAGDAGTDAATDAATDAPPPGDASARAAPVVPHTLVGSVNLFALDLDRELAANKGNLFYSPLAIAAALSMTRAGARGKTAEQIAHVLHVDPGDKHADAGLAKLVDKLVSKAAWGAPRLAIANRLWSDRGARLVPAFVKLTRADYGAPVHALDFAHRPDPARLTINRWVSARTHHRIPELLAPGSVDATTRLVLTNAIYMKAKWKTPFKKSLTRSDPFYVNGTDIQSLPTMHARVLARYGQLGAADVAELPYRSAQAGPQLSMLIVLPRLAAGMADVEKELEQRGWSAYVDALTRKGHVQVSLPRFKASMRVQLEPALEKLGMRLAFQRGADFSGMFARAAGYYISDVVHQAFVQTNEVGTTAAAATAVMWHKRALVLPSAWTFNVDHPFLFAIRDAQTGVILFAGRIDNPAA